MTNLDSHLSDRTTEKNHAVASVEAALATIEGEGRQPDQWERVYLVQAIGMLFRGGYRLSAVDAELALSPLDQRSRAPIAPDPFLDRCDISLLREGLREAAAQPVSSFPAFGPIVFTDDSL
jgi:hypothetical protein